jgi:hypothetical protein
VIIVHKGVLERLLRECKAAGIITDDLVTPHASHEAEATELERTYRGLCRLPDTPNSRRRRIDILTIDWYAKGAALLYYTVSDVHQNGTLISHSNTGR